MTLFYFLAKPIRTLSLPPSKLPPVPPSCPLEAPPPWPPSSLQGPSLLHRPPSRDHHWRLPPPCRDPDYSTVSHRAARMRCLARTILAIQVLLVMLLVMFLVMLLVMVLVMLMVMLLVHAAVHAAVKKLTLITFQVKS